MNYTDFLASKFHFSVSHGFDLEPDELNPMLKPHQRDLVIWAAKRGRAAIKLDRRGFGVELNGDYFRDGVKYLREAELQKDAPCLFDTIPEEVSA